MSSCAREGGDGAGGAPVCERRRGIGGIFFGSLEKAKVLAIFVDFFFYLTQRWFIDKGTNVHCVNIGLPVYWHGALFSDIVNFNHFVYKPFSIGF